MASRNYWWVNHKKTSKQEIDEGFLWSPFTKRNGQKNRFYDNMAEARPGDVVISYANARVSFIGTVTSLAMKAPKPTSFGSAGEDWLDEGWRLPVSWYSVPTPVSTMAVIDQLRPFLPEKYSPLSHKDGSGNQGCYLASIDEKLFEMIVGMTEFDDHLLLAGLGSEPLTFEDVENRIEEALLSSDSLSDTEVLQVQKSRRGQGEFRENVLRILDHCPLTGVAIRELLVASHIKPWRACDSMFERLDGENGIPFTPTADALFDKGFISFDDSGRLLVSSALPRAVSEIFGLQALENTPVIAVSQRRAQYLDYHRKHCFRGS